MDLHSVAVWTEEHTQHFRQLFETSIDPTVQQYRQKLIAGLKTQLKDFAEGTLGAQLFQRLAQPVFTFAAAEITLIVILLIAVLIMAALYGYATR